MKDKELPCLLLVLSLKALFIFFIILFGQIALSPDEAQYWTWSQALDIGYYSKPPGIAWEIFLGTSIFQNSELGVRSFALLIGFLLPIATYYLGKASGLTAKTSFWAAIMMALSPLGMAASFFATTDGSMVLFWTLASFVFVRGLSQNRSPDFLILGLVIACGALFKWPIYLFWIFPLCMKRFWNFSLIQGMMISLLGLFPSFIWNYQHDFGTFRHVFSTVKGSDSTQSISQGNFFDFIGAQAGLVSPILFILLLFSFYYIIKNLHETPKAIKFCFLSSFGILALFLFSAIFKKMQGNWAVFAYPTAFVCIAYVLIEKKEWGLKYVKAGVALSILLFGFVVSIPNLQTKGFSIPYRFNAFRHNVGWNNLQKALEETGYNPTEDFLFGDKYQMTSELSFYNETQKRAYFLNLNGIRKNQFYYWTSMREAEIGKTGYFVIVENAPHLDREPEKVVDDYKKRLSEYFKQVEFMGIKPLFVVDGKVVKGAFIFKAIDYNGMEPPESGLY